MHFSTSFKNARKSRLIPSPRERTSLLLQQNCCPIAGATAATVADPRHGAFGENFWIRDDGRVSPESEPRHNGFVSMREAGRDRWLGLPQPFENKDALMLLVTKLPVGRFRFFVQPGPGAELGLAKGR